MNTTNENTGAIRQPTSSGGTFIVVVLGALLALALTGLVCLLVAIGPERQRQKLLDRPFTTSITDTPAGFSTTREGRIDYMARTASYEVYEIARYVIADIGDVRIALARSPGIAEVTQWTELTGSLVIDSNAPEETDGMNSGGGGGGKRCNFHAERDRGVTTCTLNDVTFSIQAAEINVSGARIPVGTGRKVVLLRPDGSVEEVVDLERPQ